MLKNKYQYSFIGAGNMAKGLIAGIITNGESPKDIITSTYSQASGRVLVSTLGVDNTQNNNKCLNADVIVLAVKPQKLKEVLAGIDTQKLAKSLIVSVISGIPCQFYFEHISKDIRLVRTMPNMPAKIGQGMTGLYAENCSDEDKNKANKLMAYVGKTLWVKNESGIDFVNAISGSGPAYVYTFIHHLAQAGKGLGLSYQEALTLALQTLLGSTALAEKENNGSPESMQNLIGQITSKGGTTFEAIKSFENDNFATIIDNAVKQCYEKAVELGKNYH